jgi:16S rRNA (guanine966-N2)-methyltransferase
MRIIAGTLRGRRLVAPKGLDTRPTTDRVREAWFSILGPIEGRVADLYAGTGALGFEALSRGAAHAVFVESARPAFTCIADNAESLGVAARVSVVRSKLERATRDLVRLGPYELLVTDPPWTELDECERTLAELPWRELVAVGGRVVLGHPKRRPLELHPDAGLVVVSQRAWGDSGATFLERVET